MAYTTVLSAAGVCGMGGPLTKAQKEEERLEREHMAKLNDLKKELGSNCVSSSRQFREFLLERGGRLPHYLLDLEGDDDNKSNEKNPAASLTSANTPKGGAQRGRRRA